VLNNINLNLKRLISSRLTAILSDVKSGGRCGHLYANGAVVL